MKDKPIIVQSDGSILLEVQSRSTRMRGMPFCLCGACEIPEYVHTYRITHLSIWNAAPWESP